MPALSAHQGTNQRTDVEGPTVALPARQTSQPGAITGVVRNENGEPIAGAAVTLLRLQLDGVTRRLVAVSAPLATIGAAGSRTNLDGSYRLSDVPPGDYVVAASANRDQVFANVQNAALVGPAMVRVPIYFPGTPSTAGAGILTLHPGETLSGVNLSLVPVVAASVEGTIRSLRGSMQGLTVGLEPVERGVSQAESPWSPVGEDGRFRFVGVPPGDYIVKAMLPESAPDRPGTPRLLAKMWGQTAVTVSGVNVRGLVVTLEPTLTFEGRLVFDGTGPPPDGRLSWCRSRHAIAAVSAWIEPAPPLGPAGFVSRV